MDLLAWIIIGGFAGWIASIITRKNAQIGLLGNIVIGSRGQDQ